MKCPKCSAENDNTALFCTHCGIAIPVDSTCSKCGATLLPGDQFCSGCGCALGSSDASVQTSSVVQQPLLAKDEVLFRSIIGKNAEYYLAEFKKIQAGQKSLNWLAFFFSPILLLYRKMHKEFVRFILPFQIALLVFGVVSGCSLIRMVAYTDIPNTVSSIGTLSVLLVIGIAFPIVALVYLIRLLLRFNAMYLKHVSQIAEEMQQMPARDAQALATRKGQTGIKWILGYFGLLLIGWSIGIVIIVSTVLGTPDSLETSVTDTPQHSSSLEATESTLPPQRQIGSYALELTQIKTLPSSSDTIILAFFNFTNNSSTESSFDGAMYHEAYQGGIELDRTYWDNYGEEAVSNTGTKIKPGATIEVAVPYILRNPSDAVEIQFDILFSLDTNDSLAFDIDIKDVTPAGVANSSSSNTTSSSVPSSYSMPSGGASVPIWEDSITGNGVLRYIGASIGDIVQRFGTQYKITPSNGATMLDYSPIPYLFSQGEYFETIVPEAIVNYIYIDKGGYITDHCYIGLTAQEMGIPSPTYGEVEGWATYLDLSSLSPDISGCIYFDDPNGPSVAAYIKFEKSSDNVFVSILTPDECASIVWVYAQQEVNDSNIYCEFEGSENEKYRFAVRSKTTGTPSNIITRYYIDPQTGEISNYY